MKLYKLVIWSGDEDFATKEYMVREEDFRNYQNTILNGKEFLVLKDKIIKVSQIKECLPAKYEDVKDFGLAGRLPTGYDELREPTKPEKQEEKERTQASKEFGFKNLSNWAKKQSWYKKSKKLN